MLIGKSGGGILGAEVNYKMWLHIVLLLYIGAKYIYFLVLLLYDNTACGSDTATLKIFPISVPILHHAYMHSAMEQATYHFNASVFSPSRELSLTHNQQ